MTGINQRKKMINRKIKAGKINLVVAIMKEKILCQKIRSAEIKNRKDKECRQRKDLQKLMKNTSILKKT